MMGFESIIILGAGAIGSTIGAFLSKNKKVTLVGRKAHVDAINARGLLVSGNGEERYHIESTIDVRAVPKQSLIVLSTKAQDSVKAIHEIRDYLKPDSTILVLQNGIGNEDAVKTAVGGENMVLRCVTEMAAEFFEPGEIKYWAGDTHIEASTRSAAIEAIFNESGLRMFVDRDIRNRVWRKATVNCVVNPLTAIFRARNDEIVSDWLKPTRHQIAVECMRVGGTQAIRFPADMEDQIDKEIGKYQNYSSMCQDVMKHKKTEIDFLNGRITELGRTHRISTPANETMVRFIKFMEERK